VGRGGGGGGVDFEKISYKHICTKKKTIVHTRPLPKNNFSHIQCVEEKHVAQKKKYQAYTKPQKKFPLCMSRLKKIMPISNHPVTLKSQMVHPLNPALS